MEAVHKKGKQKEGIGLLTSIACMPPIADLFPMLCSTLCLFIEVKGFDSSCQSCLPADLEKRGEVEEA